ncbi:Orofacial cleft 1 candidate gene 1 protein, partial [Sciurus carolinensis]|nr:Orofacial cleft 1 candidate gene 1 protein [Sciurus carolinensis]
SLQKFQQKALKQTKQKKSKSAEFLMVKEDRAAAEGIGNPAFNMSSPDLSAHQSSEEKVIRHDMPDRSLAAHQQNSRLPAPAQPKDENMEEDPSDSEAPTGSSKSHRLHEEADETTPAYVEEFERHAQNDIVLLGSSSEQVQRSQAPQPLQIQIKCIRGLKDKAPQGSYLLKVSLLGRLGGSVLQWWPTEQLKTRTCTVRHNGNFYDVGLYFHESLHVVVPQRKDVNPGTAFLFELCLLRKQACLDQVVGWAVFPLCDNNLDVVEGKFKCPLLRGHYDQDSSSFRKIEDLICLDMDHWLCNLYFQVVKLPLHLDDQKNHERTTQLGPEFPMHLLTEGQTGKLGVHDTAGPLEKESEKNICAWMEDGTQFNLHTSQGWLT